jgi:threonine dehydrogenase-like Zn-dependent dehydrogenase
MSPTMQAVVCRGPRDYRLEQIPRPSSGPGEALIRVEALGICASDLKLLPRRDEVLGRRPAPGIRRDTGHPSPDGR